MATFPTTVKFVTFTNTTSINTIQDVEALSGKRSVILGDQIRQEIYCTTLPMDKSEYIQFDLFLKEIKGSGVITMNNLSDHLDFQPLVPQTGTAQPISVDNSAGYAIGASTINVDNNTVLTTGSYFQFANHDKIYQVFNRTNTSITITPNLYAAVPDNTGVNYRNLSGKFRIVNGLDGVDVTSTWSYNNYKQYSFILREEV